MLKHYAEIIEKIGFGDDDKQILLSKGAEIVKNFEQDIKDIIDSYEQCDFDSTKILDKREALATKSGEKLEFVDLVYLLCATKSMRERYLAKGYTDKIFMDTVKDLKYKSGVFKMRFGNLGISHDFQDQAFSMQRIALGRLQYQKSVNWLDTPYTYKDITINPGDMIYFVHIPEAGPLTKELREESYKLAFKYLDKQPDGKVYLACRTWLLCDKNPEILGTDNNIVSFMGDFDIDEGFICEADNNMWRVFGYDYDGKPENLPRNTKMQQKIADWYMKGGHLGLGRGFIILDENGRYNK